MKKLCILLAMILALACVPAMAAQGDAILGLGEEEQIGFSYCFSQGDTLYFVGFAELYTYRVGDGELTEYSYDLPEDLGEGSYEIVTLPFSEGGKLYGINLVTEYGETARFAGATITELTLQDDYSVAIGPAVEADWKDLVEYYEDNSYPYRPECIIGAAGKAILRYYDAYGEFKTAALDIASGALTTIDALDGAYLIAKYKDDTLLVEMYNYESEDQTAQFMVYDPASDSLQALGEVAVELYSPLMGVAYDEATDTIYCVKGGEICPVDMNSGEVGAGVTDMPIEPYSPVAGCVMEGGYYAFCGDGAVVRNLDMSQQSASRLKINDTSWNDSVQSAYYRFANARGDVSVVLSHEYSEIDKLVESMMNRESDIDIYVLNTSLSSYDALFNRGYLMELDGSEKVKALADRMYPSLREGLSTNGHLVALPVMMESWSLGVNEKALAALGMTLEDVPDNWSDFLDFLVGIKDALAENGNVHLFYSDYTAASARNDLFSAIFVDYQRYVSLTDPQMGYNTELLRSLLEKLEQIDFVALGCLEDDDAEDEGAIIGFTDYNEDSILLQTSSGCSIGSYYSLYTPLLMRMEPNAPAWLELDTTVAVINPFTKNPEAAMSFIDELVDCEANTVLYCLDPTMNEAVRGETNLETLNDESAELSIMREEYESADASEKQSLEQEIKDKEQIVEYYEENLWEISPKELEWYRAHDDNLVIGGYNWLYSEEAGEATDLVEQYMDGQIGVAEMLDGIDQKVRMMLLEGN